MSEEMTRKIALYCMKAYSELHSEVCEECEIYGQTGCDHCFEDALQLAIASLETDEAYQLEYEQPEFCVDCISRKRAIISITACDGKSAQIEALEKLPSVYPENTVSLSAYKQVAWERDIAIQQLHELGYEFGQKIEPTTKNDLAVDCIDRQATLDAIIKRLGIKNETYLLEAERTIYQQILAMPSVTPQEPFINKDCISSGVCEHDKNKVLDKLRTEIGKSKTEHEMQLAENNTKGKLLISHIYCDIVSILDKYKAETEET